MAAGMPHGQERKFSSAEFGPVCVQRIDESVGAAATESPKAGREDEEKTVAIQSHGLARRARDSIVPKVSCSAFLSTWQHWCRFLLGATINALHCHLKHALLAQYLDCGSPI